MSSKTQESLLGKPTEHVTTYTPSLLRTLARKEQRAGLGLQDLPFSGEDVWTAFEFSWLCPKGKPQVAAVRIRVPCSSPSIVESKSLKLYLNSFAQTHFANPPEVLRTLNSDLGANFQSPVLVELLDIDQLGAPADQFPGRSLDHLDIEVDAYTPDPQLLELDTDEQKVTNQTLHTDLFRCVCPVTGQPDWASVMVHYLGRSIVPESLLRYLISYRNHAGFHETTIEQIFMDLMVHGAPDQLTVHGRFQRRGGIEICPFRSNFEDDALLIRLPRQ